MSDHIKDIVYSHKLLQYSNIIGFSDSLQKRIKDGKEVPDTECVRLYAQFKIDKQKLDPSGLVLSTVYCNECNHSHEIDIVVLGEVSALSLTSKVRPVKSGYSIGHYKVSAGTSGYHVWINNKHYSMDNNHVVANSSSTQKPRASKGDPVLQPGVYDKGVFTDWNAQDVIGTLYDYIPIDEVGLNSVDVALVRPFTDYLLERVAYSSIVSTDFTVGKKGSYSGRTSGYKEIQVFDPSVTLQINYGKFIATFTDVVVFTPPPLPGDSGSAITTLKDAGVVEIKDEGNRPWMLLFAGSSIYGIACKISRVLESFSRQGISISFTPPPPPPPPKIAIRDLHVQVNGVRTDTISRNIPFSVVWKIVNEGTTDFDGQWFLQIRKSNGQVWFITSKSIDFSLAAGKEHNIGFMFFGILSTEPIGIWGIDAGVFIESGAIVTWYSIKMNVI